MSSYFEQDNLKDSHITLSTESKQNYNNVYCLSGLGADKRVFTKLELKGYRQIHLDWLVPNNQESLTNYVKRLAAEIKENNPILIGLSFGGIVAIEIAKQIKVKKVILISSAKQSQEIPCYFKLFRRFPIHRLIPFKSLLWAIYWLINWFFSLETQAERKLLKTILIDTDDKFLRWAIERVIFWQNKIIPDNVYHVHGASDRIFPINFIKPDIRVEKGGHFMIMNRGDHISEIVDCLLSKKE